MQFINNIQAAFGQTNDTGTLVETILLIAGFAIVAILVVTWIGGAIAGQAANISNCIAGANGSDIEVASAGCTEDTYNVKIATNTTIDENKGGRF